MKLEGNKVASQNFGKVEHQIAKFLSHFPGLKQSVKKTYQTVNFHVYKKKRPFQCDLLLKRMGSHPNGEFFGYFQNSPEQNSHIAYLVPISRSLKYRQCFPIDIFIDGKKVSETTAWNWQQGCMLWWLNEKEICHNLFEDDVYRAKVINWISNEYRLLDMPLCAVSADGIQGYSIDFENIATLNPDYGYFCKKHTIRSLNKAIHAIDIQENHINASLDMQVILDLNPRPCFHDAKHEINHISISPDSQRIMFIHRWYQSGGKKKSRLITASHDLTDLYCLADDEMVSHCSWKNNLQIIGWMQFDGVPAYYLLNDKGEKREIIDSKLLTSDGHPTVIENKWLLTDTYPDRARISHLLLYNLNSHKLIKLGEFQTPLKFWGTTRCDLHPKYSPDSKSVFFESAHTGQRCLYQMDIASLLSYNGLGN